MVLNIGSELESILNEHARCRGLTAEELAIETLKETFARNPIVPRDDWERSLLEIGEDCGVSLSNEAVSSDGIYD